MTIGIYALIFNNSTRVYIGQSKNIELRLNSHLSTMRRGTARPKLQQEYNKYGEPELIILEETLISDLDSREIALIQEYDTKNSGLNATNGGDIHFSPHSSNKFSCAKTPKESVVEVFFMLLDISNRIKDISEKTGVSITVVRDIARLANHTWLSEEFPEEYKTLKNIKDTKLRLSRKNSDCKRNTNPTSVRTSKSIRVPKPVYPNKGSIFTDAQIHKALELKGTDSYRNIAKITGISISSLSRLYNK